MAFRSEDNPTGAPVSRGSRRSLLKSVRSPQRLAPAGMILTLLEKEASEEPTPRFIHLIYGLLGLQAGFTTGGLGDCTQCPKKARNKDTAKDLGRGQPHQFREAPGKRRNRRNGRPERERKREEKTGWTRSIEV